MRSLLGVLAIVIDDEIEATEVGSKLAVEVGRLPLEVFSAAGENVIRGLLVAPLSRCQNEALALLNEHEELLSGRDDATALPLYVAAHEPSLRHEVGEDLVTSCFITKAVVFEHGIRVLVLVGGDNGGDAEGFELLCNSLRT